MALSFLRLSKASAGHRAKWARTTAWVKPEATLAACNIALLCMRALWSIGRARYLGEAASGGDIFLGGPKVLELLRPPEFGVEAKTEDLVYLDATKASGREEMSITVRVRVGDVPKAAPPS